MSVEVIKVGPIFDGRASRAAEEYADHIAREVAGYAGNRVVGEMQAHFRHPTPYYWTLIDARPGPPGDYVVESRPKLVYEWWLAGVGSRNRTSRFKGYPHWKRARASARAAVDGVQQRLWRVYGPRMGG